ncbi:antiterminator Q family protein [Xenorhabdus griffiniae]|uniref:Antiterminator Q family protein n=1 Tax=Xenorhabdus griffiniae TaxID=351672 RepID=A0ABY9XDJ1_9GAMM|nr:antiterminator Q family protein [Xenorhabdus griffiniae]MBD1228980.1 antitermination protein [Xenorhabdus griffiniae]MBE8588915.1 antitermination protein [Xenorhabdus griffiniae]WMV70980.1 antiterminator Q family protein [Xenorhabdus griffiniae]WNH00656.1 antiterminator Q family protein [Xenorhabdus griffiniae]
MRDMRMILNQWGAWAGNGNSDVDWSPIAAGFKGLVPSTRKSRTQCCDDDGIAIDAAVLRLKKYNAYYFQLIVMHYIKALPLRAMGNKLGISHNEVAKRLQAAEGFIEGVLAVSGIILEFDKCVQKKVVNQVA